MKGSIFEKTRECEAIGGVRMNKTLKLIGISALLVSMLIQFSQQALAAFVPDRSYYEPRGQIIWDIPTKEKVVALTFDDGPSETYTPQILDILKEYHAKATFFLIGKHLEAFPDIVKREVDEGNEIENHTYTHVKLTRMADDDFIKDVEKSEELIQRYQKSTIELFRPPAGALNKHIIEALTDKNYRIVLWSWHQDPRDWARPGVRHIVKHVIENIHNGDIIIMHDGGGNRSQTVKALKILLPKLEQEGYSFITVKELLKKDPRYKELFKNEKKALDKSLPSHK